MLKDSRGWDRYMALPTFDFAEQEELISGNSLWLSLSFH